MGKLGDILAHPEELLPLIRIYAATKRATQLPEDPKLAFCYDMLNRVSRSFAIVIQQLPNPLRDAICVFYLVLRALDTVEDDMALTNDIKIPALLAFHENIYDRDFTVECGYGHYVRLMQQLGTVIDVFLGLEPRFQGVIADITQRMGEGMAEFIQRDVETVADYDLYCHYVAGLVGVGLSQLFASSGLESASYARADVQSNHMGLFLQKTNIIRDYLEDINEEPAPRMFWPHEIWGEYGSSLEDFKQPANRRAAVQCLNHLVCNALDHLPYCIKFLQGLRDRDVFRFCAIPQIMAIGTLALCYNNGAVFDGVVKLRRGLTARIFDECDGMREVYVWFTVFLQELQEKALLHVDKTDPTREVSRRQR
ncbi:farnesyl-diphosphate farnesyltransferase [Scenedesmus sp. NREL 46B-D3]|nr:farnesyl-diphosphate farnesyltransferase [Scenedesmus sp. NREL 46B-D3]